MTGILWEQFDPERYIKDNYATLHDEDRQILNILIPLYEKMLSGGERVLDIGTGPNLYPLVVVLPYAARVDCLEISSQNVQYLKRELNNPSAHWRAFLRFMEKKSSKYNSDLLRELARKIHIYRGSIFDNTRTGYDMVSMFFCAESITNSKYEFTAACKRFVSAARREGLLVAAFMENSTEYRIGSLNFPAYPVAKELLIETFQSLCNDFRIYHIDVAARPLRSGYTGMLLLVGRRK